MGLINSDELKQLQALAEEAMSDTCTIRRRSEEDDGAGSFRRTLLVIGSVPCTRSVLGNNPQEQVIAARLAGRNAYKIKVPARVSVLKDDQLTIGDNVYEVVEPLHQTYPIATVVICQAIS